MVNSIKHIVSGLWQDGERQLSEFKQKTGISLGKERQVPDAVNHQYSHRIQQQTLLDKMHGYLSGNSMQAVVFTPWTAATLEIINTIQVNDSVSLQDFLVVAIRQCRVDRQNQTEEALYALEKFESLVNQLPHTIRVNTNTLAALNNWESTGTLSLEPNSTDGGSANSAILAKVTFKPSDLARYSDVLPKLAEKLLSDLDQRAATLVSEEELVSVFNQIYRFINNLRMDACIQSNADTASWAGFFKCLERAQKASDASRIQGRRPYESSVMNGLERLLTELDLLNYPIVYTYKQLLAQAKNARVES